MASLIWHKKDGTRTTVEHISGIEMEAARQRHDLYGIFNLQEGIKRQYQMNYKFMPHYAADVARGVKYWKDAPFCSGDIYELCDKDYTTLVEAYYWRNDNCPMWPHDGLP